EHADVELSGITGQDFLDDAGAGHAGTNHDQRGTTNGVNHGEDSLIRVRVQLRQATGRRPVSGGRADLRRPQAETQSQSSSVAMAEASASASWMPGPPFISHNGRPPDSSR